MDKRKKYNVKKQPTEGVVKVLTQKEGKVTVTTVTKVENNVQPRKSKSREFFRKNPPRFTKEEFDMVEYGRRFK